MITVRVRYWSWFRDLAGAAEELLSLPAGATVGDALERVWQQRPRLSEVRRSALVAVGVEYQSPDYTLKDGEELSLFPPVQGG